MSNGRAIRDMRWGFQPGWSKPLPGRPPPINARAETLLDRALFRDAVAAGRCIIPADGFYEWQPIPGGRRKQPMFIRLNGGGLFGFAGLWAACRSKTGEPIQTCAIVTTAPNDLMEPIHNRMPVILRPDDEALWLDRSMRDCVAAMACLRPYPAALMEVWPVATLVNSADNDGPELVERLAG
jgi:putative SOS response-associated peptidase YedK